MSEKKNINTGSEVINFCHQASSQYEQMLEECGGDPRLVLARRAIQESKKVGGGWVPTWDDRAHVARVPYYYLENRGNR